MDHLWVSRDCNFSKLVEMLHLPDTKSTLVSSLLLLLFRHSAKSLNAQEERLATCQARVVRLHVRKSNVVILIPEPAGTVSV